MIRAFFILALVAACGNSGGGATTTTPDVPPSPPPPTTAPVLLVANKGDATLSILELPGGRVLATLPTGVGPHEIAVSPDGRRAVVSNYGDQFTPGRSLTVVDLPTLAVERTIDLGDYRRPHGLAFLADGRRVVVTAEVNASVVIVDVEAGQVERGVATSQQGSHMLALTRDRTRAWVANIGSGTLSSIDLVAFTGSEPTPAIAKCEGVAVTPDGGEVWTASLEENQIVVLGGSPLAEVARIPGGGVPIRVTATPDGRTMLVSNVQGSALQVIDVATRAVTPIRFEPVAGDTAAPVGTVVSDDGARAYVALVAEDRVAVLDLTTRTIVGHHAVGHGPDGLAYSTVFASP